MRTETQPSKAFEFNFFRTCLHFWDILISSLSFWIFLLCIAPDLTTIRTAYDTHIESVMAEATLTIPDSRFAHKGGKSGFQHSEHLGHILTQMQWLQRAYPGATW